MTYTRVMGKARIAAEDGQLSGVYAGLLRRISPQKVGAVTGCGLALAAALTTAVEASRGADVALQGGLLFAGVEGLAARLFLSLLAGLVAGYVVGNGLARLRNAVVAAYLRVVWSRYQHHVANDLLDKL